MARPQRPEGLQPSWGFARPPHLSPGIGHPPAPGWEWYVIDMVEHIASLVESMTMVGTTPNQKE